MTERPILAGATDHTHPADHAFVIRFRLGTDPTNAHVYGRIEHVVSGRGARFVSYEDMLGFMRRILAERLASGSREDVE